ncbi:MAG: STAS-like domain-containing protein [Phycisphaerae bacterium]|nr:STAS-like domain-containing protein [Phycisphaerae bacterium]
MDSLNRSETVPPIVLRQYGEFLSTRVIGEDVRRLVEAIVEDGGEARIDFTGVDGITISFADEVFGKLALKWGLERLRGAIRSRNAHDEIARTISFAVNGRLSAPPARAAE